MPLQLPRWSGPNLPAGLGAWVNSFAGTLERSLTAGAQLGINAAPNGPAGGGLAGQYPNPVVLATRSETSIAATSGTTVSAAAFTGGIILRSGPSTAFTDMTDTAANLVSALAAPARVAGQSFEVMIANMASAAMALAPGNGISFAGNLSGGNFAIGAGATRILRAVVTATGTAAVTFYG
jgi:hypothetical protein